jgi:hypothetical protein
MYSRYGHQVGGNWGLIDGNFVMLSFFNKSNYVESLALYKRSRNNGIIDFFTSYQLNISSIGIKQPKAVFLNSNNITNLFIFENDKPGSKKVLALYNITDEFSLLVNYSKPGSFSSIKVIASNDYYTR